MSGHEQATSLATRLTEDAKALSQLLDQSNDSVPAATRQSLFEASWGLQRLVMSPGNILEEHQVHYQLLSCLRWLLHFKVLDHVPLPPSSGTPFADIAQSAKVPLTQLKSVARMSMTSGFLSEPKPGYLAHSRLSAQFASVPTLHDWATFITTLAAPTAEKYTDATEKWGETVRKDQTAYNVAFKTDLPFFEDIARDKERVETFARYMRNQGQSEGLALKHVLDGFDWAGLGNGHVVDVGGSTGAAAIFLAQHLPGLQLTVQDLPEVLSNAENNVSSLPESIKSRINFQPHSFFDPQPSTARQTVDVFFLRKVLHDWSFHDAQKILGHLAEAMKPNASVVVMDTILPPPGRSRPNWTEASLRVRDMAMAQSLNAEEREMEEWVRLVEGVKPGLKLVGYEQPKGSVMALLVLKRK